MRFFEKLLFLTVIPSLFFCAPDASKKSVKPIQIYEKNPYYFVYNDKPVLLLGGSDEDNLFNHPGLMRQNFEILENIGGNYIRCTMSSRDSGNVWPFAGLENGKYDLNVFNDAYWDRFEQCLKEAEAREIIVQIEIWATFDFYRDNWLVNPFNPANNVNYTTENTRLETAWPHHPAREPQPFVFSIPEKNNDTELLKYQQKFVDKLTGIGFKYGNVLYCMDNETRAPAEWAWYWAKYIRDKAQKSGINILLTEMWDAHDLHNEEHERTYDHPDLFSFFDISQNNWQEGQTHYDNALWVRDLMKDHGGIRPLTNIKVYHRRHGNRPNEPAIGVDRWWENIFAGCAGTRFHRPTGGTGLNPLSQKMIKAAQTFTASFNIFECMPRPDLLADAEDNEAYCLAESGKTYALYFPRGGKVNLAIENREKDLKLAWFNTDTSGFLSEETINSKDTINLVTPDKNRIWLALIRK